MAGINKIILMGNIGRDPELKTTASGKKFCKFSLATSRKDADGTEVTNWHNCTAWNKTGEAIAQYVKKGQMLYIEGSVEYGSYDKDGQKVYTTDIFVKEFAFCGGSAGGKPEAKSKDQFVNDERFPAEDDIPF